MKKVLKLKAVLSRDCKTVTISIKEMSHFYYDFGGASESTMYSFRASNGVRLASFSKLNGAYLDARIDPRFYLPRYESNVWGNTTIPIDLYKRLKDAVVEYNNTEFYHGE